MVAGIRDEMSSPDMLTATGFFRPVRLRLEKDPPAQRLSASNAASRAASSPAEESLAPAWLWPFLERNPHVQIRALEWQFAD